jgi:hypothetical protein
MKTYGKWKYSTTILDRHWMKVSGQLHTLTAVFPGKKAPVPIVYGVGWPQSRSGLCEDENNVKEWYFASNALNMTKCTKFFQLLVIIGRTEYIDVTPRRRKILGQTGSSPQ